MVLAACDDRLISNWCSCHNYCTIWPDRRRRRRGWFLGHSMEDPEIPACNRHNSGSNAALVYVVLQLCVRKKRYRFFNASLGKIYSLCFLRVVLVEGLISSSRRHGSIFLCPVLPVCTPQRLPCSPTNLDFFEYRFGFLILSLWYVPSVRKVSDLINGVFQWPPTKTGSMIRRLCWYTF